MHFFIHSILFNPVAFIAETGILSIPFLLLFGTLVLLIMSYVLFKNQATYNSELVENTNATDLTIKAARLITFFGAIIIPLGGIVYRLAFNGDLMVTYLHLILGILLFALMGLSFLVKKIESYVQHYIVLNFFLILAFYQAIVYLSSIEAYFIISLILALATGGTIIYSMRIYVGMSIVILLSALLIAYLVENPQYNLGLYLFGMLASCAVGILILTVKLNLSEKLIFADTIVNKGNSLVIASNKKGEIIYVSENISEILGYAKNEVMGDKWWQLTTADNGIEVKNAMLENTQQNQTYNRLIKHKDGTERWIQWTDKRFSDDLIFGIGTDITIQKKYQERFEYIVNNANDLIYTTDALGNFTYANQMVLKITERSIDEFVGMNFLDIIATSHRKEVQLFYLREAKKKSVKTYYEFPINTKSKREVWVGQSVTNYFNASTQSFEGTQVICRDITDRIAIQSQLDDTNKQLNLLNTIKENILYSKNIEEVCTTILDTIISTAKVTSLASIHINNDWQQKSYIYTSLKEKERKVNSISTDYEDFQSMEIYFPNIITERELYLSKDELEIWEPLFFYTQEEYKSALIVPVVFENKIIGFLNLFSKQENVFHTGDSFLLNDVANSVNAFVASYKQKQIIEEKNVIIEKNNQRLDILNKSKQNLLIATTIEQVHRELIIVLKTNLLNLDRVSTCQFDFKREQAHLFYLNTTQNNIVESKMIGLDSFTPLEDLKINQFYYKPNFDKETALTADDQHWYDVGIRSVLCAPIFINNELHSCVNLLSAVPDNFDESHKALIKEIVDSTALVIEQIIFKNIISEKNKDITDNITYAKRIQDAIMPKESSLQKILPESFLFFSQKDILGGDFYWFDKLEDKTYIAVGDCTGHGVSGALLSILASDVIKQAVVEMRFNDTGTILQYLNHKIISTLNQSTYNTLIENEIVDGLDISFVIINHRQQTLSFSSAMHTAFLIRNKEIIELKGNRKPIGVAHQDGNDFFATHIITIKEGDSLYFLTDGYCDQFHYQTSKKFGKANFKKVLLDINNESMSQQLQSIRKLHENWKGSNEQTDDICLMGIKM